MKKCPMCGTVFSRSAEKRRQTERNAEVARMRQSGATFAEIATALNISRQRAHQIYHQETDGPCRSGMKRGYYRVYPKPGYSETVVATELRQIREERNIARIALAKQMGVSDSAIHCWETGKHIVKLDALKVWADVMGMELKVELVPKLTNPDDDPVDSESEG